MTVTEAEKSARVEPIVVYGGEGDEPSTDRAHAADAARPWASARPSSPQVDAGEAEPRCAHSVERLRFHDAPGIPGHHRGTFVPFPSMASTTHDLLLRPGVMHMTMLTMNG
jgi:hypothetical protein